MFWRPLASCFTGPEFELESQNSLPGWLNLKPPRASAYGAGPVAACGIRVIVKPENLSSTRSPGPAGRSVTTRTTQAGSHCHGRSTLGPAVAASQPGRRHRHGVPARVMVRPPAPGLAAGDSDWLTAAARPAVARQPERDQNIIG